jgi:hypothetical protein
MFFFYLYREFDVSTGRPFFSQDTEGHGSPETKNTIFSLSRANIPTIRRAS